MITGRIISFLVSFSLISISTLLPITIPETIEKTVIQESFNSYHEPAQLLYNKDQIQEIYETLLEKISINEDPTPEFAQLFSQPEIRNIIEDISDEQTVETIKVLFSNQNKIGKLTQLADYIRIDEKRRSNESVQVLENMLTELVEANLTPSPENILLPEHLKTNENKTLLYISWETFLSNNPQVESIIATQSFDPVIFFICFSISMAIWGFAIGAISCCIPELIPIAAMFTVALILGLGGGLLVDFIFSSNIPIVNTLITSICSLLFITPGQLETVCACLLCLIIIGTYLYLWNVCPIAWLKTMVKMTGGGIMVVGPPFLFSWFMANYFPVNNNPEPEPLFY